MKKRKKAGMERGMRDPCGENGSVLVAVLWALFFLSALAAAIYAQLAPQIALTERLKDRAQLYYLAKAGMEKAMVVLEGDETRDYDALNDVWANGEDALKDLRLGEEGYVNVYYESSDEEEEEPQLIYGLMDEERKININKSSSQVLKRFFEEAGQATSQTAGDIADSILDWVDEDDDPRENGAEKGYYESLSGGYSCKNGEFQVLEELFLIKGMTPEIFEKTSPYLTVYGTGKVNLNTAGKPVLEGLGMSAGLAEKLIEFRAGSDRLEGTEDDNVFPSVGEAATALANGGGLSAEESEQLNAAVAAGLVDVRSDYFRGESHGIRKDDEDDETGVTAKIVFVLDRQKNIRYWRE